MYSIELMIAEHDNILKFNQAVRNACGTILEGKDICTDDFEKMIAFARNYADKHHHGKEEQLLFNEMQKYLGTIGLNLITHGMLVEHDWGRLHISELEAALNKYKENPSAENKLDIIANAVGYTNLLKRHINKENDVVYSYAEKNLTEDVLKIVNEKTAEFEKLAEDNGIQKKYLGILHELSEKYQ